jgi:hypothetical protein
MRLSRPKSERRDIGSGMEEDFIIIMQSIERLQHKKFARLPSNSVIFVFAPFALKFLREHRN